MAVGTATDDTLMVPAKKLPAMGNAAPGWLYVALPGNVTFTVYTPTAAYLAPAAAQ